MCSLDFTGFTDIFHLLSYSFFLDLIAFLRQQLMIYTTVPRLYSKNYKIISSFGITIQITIYFHTFMGIRINLLTVSVWINIFYCIIRYQMGNISGITIKDGLYCRLPSCAFIMLNITYYPDWKRRKPHFYDSRLSLLFII